MLKEPEAVARAIIDVNVHGIINGTKAVAPGMVDRGHGHIVNVASAVGRIAVADGATYSASKFAAVGFSEATRAELKPLGIDVSVVLPTVVQTELAVRRPGRPRGQAGDGRRTSPRSSSRRSGGRGPSSGCRGGCRR